MNTQKGYSLLEATTALAIFAILLVGVAQGFDLAPRIVDRIEARQTLLSECERALEGLRSGELPLRSGTVPPRRSGSAPAALRPGRGRFDPGTVDGDRRRSPRAARPGARPAFAEQDLEDPMRGQRGESIIELLAAMFVTTIALSIGYQLSLQGERLVSDAAARIESSGVEVARAWLRHDLQSASAPAVDGWQHRPLRLGESRWTLVDGQLRRLADGSERVLASSVADFRWRRRGTLVEVEIVTSTRALSSTRGVDPAERSAATDTLRLAFDTGRGAGRW